jgi:hypothetical protein
MKVFRITASTVEHVSRQMGTVSIPDNYPRKVIRCQFVG